MFVGLTTSGGKRGANGATSSPERASSEASRPREVAARSLLPERGSAAARRGLDKVDTAYDELRHDVLALVEEMREKLSSRK